MSAAFSTAAATVASTEAKGSRARLRGGAGLAARDARIRVARATPGRCGILLHNRVRGRIKALDGGKSRTKKVPRGKFPPEPRRVQIGVQSSKFGMAGSPGML
jgi:hypothetical protein